MADEQILQTLYSSLLKSILFISNGLEDFVSRNMEIERSARMGAVLINASNRHHNVFDKLTDQIILSQESDGGWRNVEESLWCAEVLKKLGNKKNVSKAYCWLKSQKSLEGGWGQNTRDFPRIPLTSLMLIFHQELFEEKDIDWLTREIKEEVFGDGNVVLTYKISLPIAAFKMNGLDFPEKEKMLEVLIGHQNDDGGFAPWKNHPTKSDIISSAYALLAMSGEEKYERERQACLNWVVNSQMENGGWPYHYIDHGTAMGAFCINETINKILSQNKHEI